MTIAPISLDILEALEGVHIVATAFTDEEVQQIIGANDAGVFRSQPGGEIMVIMSMYSKDHRPLFCDHCKRVTRFDFGRCATCKSKL